MAEDVVGKVFDVLRGDEGAAAEESERAGGLGEGDGAAWAGTAADQIFQLGQQPGRIPAGTDDVDDVILHWIRNHDFVHDGAAFDDLRGINDRRSIRICRRSAHDVQDPALFGTAGVVDFDLEKKAVQLRLGELISSFLIDGILRRHDHEGIR